MERQRKTFAQFIIEKMVARKNMVKKLSESLKNQVAKQCEHIDDYEEAYDYNDCHQDYFDANPE